MRCSLCSYGITPFEVLLQNPDNYQTFLTSKKQIQNTLSLHYAATEISAFSVFQLLLPNRLFGVSQFSSQFTLRFYT